MFRSIFAVLTILTIFSASGCKTAKKAEEVSDSTSAAADDNTLGDSDSGKAMGLQTVRFPYDSFNLDSQAKTALKANAAILKGKESTKIQVEGHCDSRGGIQYNIALGEKRANAVKKFLQDQGISGDRIATISYGKERLLDSAETEAAHAKNRRANFAVTSR